MNFDSIYTEMPWHRRIGFLRATKGWTQQEAAGRCGTTKKNYWLWEAGKSEPRYNSKRAIAAAYEVRVEDIFKS